MASLDYGSGGLDSFADYEWNGQHYFAFDSDVILEFSVDIQDPVQALRAVNAGTVVSYVDSQFSQLLGAGSNVGFQSKVNFSGQERVSFSLSPVIAETFSLWDIDNLATWPDQVQLSSAATIGDVKDYVDQNLTFAVEYIKNTTQESILNEVRIQLPIALPSLLNEQLTPLLDTYSTNSLLPEIDRRISAALSNGQGLTFEEVNGIIDTRLPLAIESYADNNIYPNIGSIAVEAVSPALDQLYNAVRQELTAQIDEKIANIGAGGLTEDNVVALINAILPTQVTQLLDAQLPDSINTLTGPIVDAQLAAQLPTAIRTGLEQNSEVILTTLAPAVTQTVETTLGETLPSSVNSEVSNQLPLAVKNHLDLTFEDTVSGYLDATLPTAIDAELDLRITSDSVWPLVQDQADNQTHAILGQYFTGSTLWPLVSEQAGIQALTISASVVGETVTQEGIWNLIEGVSATQTDGQIRAALAEFEANLGNLNPDTIWTGINQHVQTAIDSSIIEAFPTLAQDTILDNLTGNVTNELQLQLPTLVPEQVQNALDNALPGRVRTEFLTNLNDALTENGQITTAIDARIDGRVDARAEEVITNTLNTSVLPLINTEVQNTVAALTPPIVEQQITTQLQTVIPALVEDSVNETMQLELDNLVATTIPNIVNIEMSSTLDTRLEEALLAWFGDSRPPIHRRYHFNSPQQFWVIEHEFIGASFTERLYNSLGIPMFASIEVVNETSFVVKLTEAYSGWVDVEFYV
ncbi:hypothetical protein [Pseudoalteromonas umbrosa]|uniref:hypothetical protein n=1 Tax=Pseudoalteromonas umbrosa TaxID=3048489 RepID=UPI0024C3EE60|nr:hypothetical protein [Pseudoalteromonas sp. B95]MDK1290234.1 hypothetical protein [Pseudoalteromonas sp. B95]